MRRYHAVFVQKNKYTLRTWQTEDAHSLVQELNNKMAGGDYNGIGSPDKSGGKFFNSIENLHLKKLRFLHYFLYFSFFLSY